MGESIKHPEQVPLKELVRDEFTEWCQRNNFQVPETPTELLNKEQLTAAQTGYVWSVISFLH